eukprot:12905584-Ditylum_brightwellii.AAC.1
MDDDKLCGDFSICGIWQQQTDTIIDICVTNSDAKSYQNWTIENHLKTQDKEEKKKYLHICQDNWKNFTPFIVMVDRVFGHKAHLLMKQLACALSKKWVCHVSHDLNYVKTMLSIAVVRATH